MPKKAILIRFCNASLFTNRRRTSDKVVDGTERRKRDQVPQFDVPEGYIHLNHVSNLLHVLMGERPVPSLRKSMARPDPGILNAARQSRFRMEEISRQETKTVRKAVNDAWNTVTQFYYLNGKNVKVKGGLLYPSRLKRFLGEHLYQQFYDLVESYSGGKKLGDDISVQQGIELLNQHSTDPEVRNFVEACKNARRKDLVNLIGPDGNVQAISLHQGTGSKLNILLVNAGVEEVSRYSGVLFVPVEDEGLLLRLNHGTGVGTFLEGGCAFLCGVEDWSEDLVFDSKPVVDTELQHVPK
jgi:hypothetical protein